MKQELKRRLKPSNLANPKLDLAKATSGGENRQAASPLRIAKPAADVSIRAKATLQVQAEYNNNSSHNHVGGKSAVDNSTGGWNNPDLSTLRDSSQ